MSLSVLVLVPFFGPLDSHMGLPDCHLEPLDGCLEPLGGCWGHLGPFRGHLGPFGGDMVLEPLQFLPYLADYILFAMLKVAIQIPQMAACA